MPRQAIALRPAAVSWALVEQLVDLTTRRLAVVLAYGAAHCRQQAKFCVDRLRPPSRIVAGRSDDLRSVLRLAHRLLELAQRGVQLLAAAVR